MAVNRARPVRRVAFITQSFAEYTLRLASAVAHQAEVIVIAPKHSFEREVPPAVHAQLSRPGVYLYNGASLVDRLRSIPGVLAALASFNPDVVHYQSDFGVIELAVATRFSPGRRIVGTIHDPAPHSGSDSKFARKTRWTREALRSRMDILFAHGPWCAELLAAVGVPKNRIMTTRHGAILEPRANALQTSEPGRLLFFGRAENYKGLPVLIQAMDRLADRDRSVTLHIAARGPVIDELRPILLARSDVELTEDFLSYDDAVECFQRASIVVLPYLNATQSGVAAAALTNLRPTVATRVGDIPEIVRDGETGLLCRPDDVNDLVLCIERQLDSANGAATSQRLVEAKRRMLDWPGIASDLIAAYRGIDDRK